MDMCLHTCLYCLAGLVTVFGPFPQFYIYFWQNKTFSKILIIYERVGEYIEIYNTYNDGWW